MLTPPVQSVVLNGKSTTSGAVFAADAPLMLAFDVETTGLDASADRVVEMAVVDCETGEAFSTLVKPGHARLPIRITELTGIDNKMVNASHVPGFALAAERLELQIAAWAGRRSGASIVLAAHNAKFDVDFLRAEYTRAGRVLPAEWRFTDSLGLARALLPQRKSHKLADLNTHFKLSQHGAHRAEGDAQMLRSLLGPLGLGSLAPDVHARLLRSAFAAKSSANALRRNTSASVGAVEADPVLVQSLLEEADMSDELETEDAN